MRRWQVEFCTSSLTLIHLISIPVTNTSVNPARRSVNLANRIAQVAAPDNTIHLVLGDSAAGCVRAACASCGMPGTVIGFFGDLAYGPLDDRGALASQWRSVITRLLLEHPESVIVWSAENVSDTIFLALACDRLAGRSEPLLSIRVPAIDGRPFVAMHAPEQIAQLYPRRSPLSAADRLSLARDFARIRDSCGPVRRLEQGRVLGATIDCYDSLLMEACAVQWQAAGHVVGAAMAHCDAPNLPGDRFFFDRLGCLVDTGDIDARGQRSSLRAGSVRVRQSSSSFIGAVKQDLSERGED